MKHSNIILILLIFTALISCSDHHDHDDHGAEDGHHADHAEQAPAGSHGGRLLQDGEFSLEIAIFEAGTPPEFRVWVTHAGKPVDPTAVDLHITLDRLGDVTDNIQFQPVADYLRGDTTVYEPHSFEVTVSATYQGTEHRWNYENLEGRTHITRALAEASGIATELAGPATINDYATLYGRIEINPQNVSHVMARFDGVVETVHAAIGDTVTAGQALASIEANDSLNSYTIPSPITGTVVERHANPGESTSGRSLFTIIDTRWLQAELAIFPQDQPRIHAGMPVELRTSGDSVVVSGNIDFLSPIAGNNQTVTARVPLDNANGKLAAGMYVTAQVAVARHDVALAVRRSGLQPFRDFTVVYANFGETYEVRMLELGRQDKTWVEVLGGLSPGTRYVTDNSYVLKADVEKAGAAHDH